MATMYKWKKYNLKDETYTTRESYTDYETQTYTEYVDEIETYYEDGPINSSYYSTREAASSAASSYRSQGYSVAGPYEAGDYGYQITYGKRIKKTRTVKKPVTRYKSVPVTKYRNVTKTRQVKGSYVEEVKSSNRSAYPDNGQKSGYWYEYAGLANQAPSLTGSSTQIGNVKSDFTITYTVTDPDGDEVKVGIMVDNKVIQYPMAVPLNRSQSVTIRLEDYPLGEHTVTVTATDTSNASTSRTYYFSKTNQAPTISGSDLDMGGQYKDFSIDYIVQDADGDSVKVEIKLDGAIKQSPTATTLGVRKYYTVPIKSVDLGRHTIEIIATDSQGASSTRVYTFQKVNSAPVISGQDENLGAKNTGFSYTYTVTDNEEDSVKVVEKVNGNIIRTLKNVTLGASQTITITDEQIKNFELNGLNTIEIEASDGATTTYRRITFVRNNMPPIISDKDKDLGTVTNSLTYNWSATDPEKDPMTATIYLDDKILKARYKLAEGASQNIKIDGLDMLKIPKGLHEIRIVVEDDKGFKSTRKVTFTRKIERLVMKLNGKGIETDELAKRVLISTVGIYVAKGAVIKYEVCNNSFDAKPTWEDATVMVGAGKAFNFQNKTKTATKAGIDIRVTIEKGTATMQSYISAIGGSFD